MTRPSWLIPAGCVLAVCARQRAAAVGARRARHRAPPTHSRPTITRCSKTFRAARFDFFWEQADPATGIVRDRARTDGSTYPESHREIGSIASTGFGLTGLCIAAERGWKPDGRAEGARPQHAAVLRGPRVRQPRLVLSLAEHPHGRARVEERGVVDRHGAAGGRRHHAAPVLQRRRGRRAAGDADLRARRFHVDAQRASDAALARLAAGDRLDSQPMGGVQRAHDPLRAWPGIADASAAGRVMGRVEAAALHVRATIPTCTRCRRSSFTSTRRPGSTSGLFTIRCRRSPTGTPTRLSRPTHSGSSCWTCAPSFLATRRRCGASPRRTRAADTRPGAAPRATATSTAASCRRRLAAR